MCGLTYKCWLLGWTPNFSSPSSPHKLFPAAQRQSGVCTLNTHKNFVTCINAKVSDTKEWTGCANTECQQIGKGGDRDGDCGSAIRLSDTILNAKSDVSLPKPRYQKKHVVHA